MFHPLRSRARRDAALKRHKRHGDIAWTISSICPCFRLDPNSTRGSKRAGVTVRRALAPELELATGWIREKFSAGWVERNDDRFFPAAALLLPRHQGARKLVGFACYDSIARGFFGPTGVDEEARGGGIGRALLLATLLDMRTLGYGYAIIGDVGPSEFYERTVGATPIPDSEPGVYAGLLKLE